MPVRDYRAYAQTPKGKEARARAHARYVAKRRERTAPINFNASPLVQAINHWRTE